MTSLQRRVIYLAILATLLALDGVGGEDASNDTTTHPQAMSTFQTTQRTSNEAETELLLEPKNCTRTKMITVTVQESFIDICTKQIQTCSWCWFRKTCRKKDVYDNCVKYRQKKMSRSTVEQTCCKGFVPYNDTSAFCVKGCDPGKYGENCTYDCNCTGNTRPDCHIITGECKCVDGWTGRNCTDVCDAGFYGRNCENVCACENNSTCDHVNGTCNCTVPGWTGDTCDTECLQGKYGYNCNQTCSCPPNATCEPHSGQCRCIAGLTGANCTEVCDAGSFGADCQQTCTCLANSTRACDPVNGTCDCIAGWTGRSCTEYCDLGTYGEMCQEKCNCTRTEACNPINGECISRFVCSENGTSNCDPEFGVNGCMNVQRNMLPELLQGTIRDILNNPKDICDSGSNETLFCVPNKGQVLCECFPGWTGHSCEKHCPSGTHGSGCRSNCTCDDDEACDPVDGQCSGTGKSAGQKAHQGTAIVLVVGVVIASVLVICLVVIGVVFYKRKGGPGFRNIKVTVRKTRSASERSFAENRTYELQQPEIIGDASSGPIMPEDRLYENDVFTERIPRQDNSQDRKKATIPSKDSYSRVVKTDDGCYDNFENMRHSDDASEMYKGQVIDGVYNELNNRNGRKPDDVAAQEDEYSHGNAAASSDVYDVMKGKVESTGGDNMYESSRELSNTYDVFRKKEGANVITDSMYDTNESVAAGLQNSSKLDNWPG